MTDGKSKNVHSGHRARLRGQFLTGGLDPLPDENVLELLLFYAIPRQDTNPIAHRLLREFGSLPAVLDADLEELQRRGGLTEPAAALLKLVPAVSKRAALRRRPSNKPLQTVQDCGSYLLPYFLDAPEECVYLLALDSACLPLGVTCLGSGSSAEAGLNIREAAAYALRMHAFSVVLAHNHPSGTANPSEADLRSTEALAAALRPLGIALVDHIIFAGGSFLSLRETGHIKAPE